MKCSDKKLPLSFELKHTQVLKFCFIKVLLAKFYILCFKTLFFVMNDTSMVFPVDLHIPKCIPPGECHISTEYCNFVVRKETVSYGTSVLDRAGKA